MNKEHYEDLMLRFTKEMHDWFGTPDWVVEKSVK